jgi:hypothetical protein
LEKELGWEGILIEADPDSFEKLLKKHRKAWKIGAALSTNTFPKLVSFQFDLNKIFTI